MLLLIAIVLANHQFQLFGQYRSRYLLLLWIPGIVLFAYGIAAKGLRPVIVVLWLVLWGAAAYQFQRSSGLTDYIGGAVYARWYPPLQDYAFQLQGKVRAHDHLIGFTVSDYLNSERKHGKSAADYYTQALLHIDGAFLSTRLSGDALLADFNAKTDDNPYLLFAYEPQARPANLEEVLDLIRSKYRACGSVIDNESLHVERFVDRSLSCDREYEPVQFDIGLRMVDRYGAYEADAERLRIVTGWETAEDALLYEYNVSLQIITTDGRNVLQTDQHLYADVLKWYRVSFSTDELPAGNYTAVAIVYDRETGERAAGADLRSGESSEMIPILSFTVDD